MKAETKKKVFNVVEKPPDARKGTIKRVKMCVFQHRSHSYYLVPSVLTDPNLKIDGDILVAKANYF